MIMIRSAFPFTDINNIINHIPDGLKWLLIGKGIDYLLKHYKLIFRPNNFRNNFGWFQLCCLGIVLVISYDLEILFKKIHAKPFARVMKNNYRRILEIGFVLFYKIEPELAYR